MTLEYPHVLINFKTYEGTYGADAVSYARTVETICDETNATFVVAPQTVDLRLVAESTSLSVVAQSIDTSESGRDTGAVLPEAVVEAGADAAIINHPENPDTLAGMETKIRRCATLGLNSLVSVNSVEMGRAVLAFDPDCLIFENPEDIATGKPLSQANPELVETFVAMVAKERPRTKVLLGGGISTVEDVDHSFELGVDAAGAASAAVQAPDRRAWLEAIADAF